MRAAAVGRSGLLPSLALLVALTTGAARAYPARSQQDTGVTELRAAHRSGQTFLTWRESSTLPALPGNATVGQVRARRAELAKQQGIRYRIYRSSRAIVMLGETTAVAEVAPLSVWNTEFYGNSPKPDSPALRYVIEDGAEPLGPNAGLYVATAATAGEAYYAVTTVLHGIENRALTAANNLSTPVQEVTGRGDPVLQRTERPASFNFVKNPTLDYYVRWESPPHSNRDGVPNDYVVGVPTQVRKPAPVGIHMHGWGGSLSSGYGWWFNADNGAMLLASNLVPYDWWTGYHEHLRIPSAVGTADDWRRGVVRPYSQRRMLSFLEWMEKKSSVDRTRVFAGGVSMGGSGAIMLAIRHPEQVAWAIGWVGVHQPRQSPQFRSSYERVFGKPEWNVRFEDGTPVWDHFDDAWYLRRHVDKSVGFITFSNGKNDQGIGWAQAVDFLRALQEARQPHMFVWGQGGHGQRALMPGEKYEERVMPTDLRTDQSLPAFTNCSLDDNPGNGDPADGDAAGQVNSFLTWDTTDVVDEVARWEMTLSLTRRAPAAVATVSVTPRRTQRFHPKPDEIVEWSAGGERGQARVDPWGRVTIEAVPVTQSGIRLRLRKSGG